MSTKYGQYLWVLPTDGYGLWGIAALCYGMQFPANQVGG